MQERNLHGRDDSYSGTDPYGVPSLQCGKPDSYDDDFDQQLLTQNTGEELTGPNIFGSSQLFQFCAHFRELESNAFFLEQLKSRV